MPTKINLTLIFFLPLVVLIGLGSGISSTLPDSLAELSKLDGRRVILKELSFEKESLGTQSLRNEIDESEIKRKSGDLISVEFSKKLSELISSGRFEIMGIDKEIGIFLQDAKGIINASSVWNLTSSGSFIDGVGTSVCVIDTGVDKTHPDLSGKVLGEYCYCSAKEGASSACCPDGTSEDNNATDNHGHGTHVSGIVSASGGIEGISKGSSLVVVKVLNSSGVGYDSDLKLAIEWCSNDTQINQYNISTISISLGGGQYNSESACSLADSFNVQSAIDAAVLKNISVVVATGNGNATNNVDGIASPACLSSTTRVTASDKSDNFASYAFRNSNFSDILVAPGSNINSTQIGGGYFVDSGTSMATPMVSGIISLLNQYLNLSSREKSPLELKNLLNVTGLVLDDSANSGANFSRINGYSAILSIDVDSPNVTLISPVDSDVNVSQNRTFICNSTDWQLSNVTFYIWNFSGGLYYNETKNISGESNQSSFNLTEIPFGSYRWNCESFDVLGNNALESSNNSLTVGGISVTLTSPLNNTYTNNNSINFSCSFSSEQGKDLVNSTFYLWNSSENLIFNKTENISGLINTTVANYSFSLEGNYSWNCFGENNASNSSFAVWNYTLVYDNSSPMISNVLNSSISSTGATISWTTNEVANSSVSGDISGSSSDLVTSHSLLISGLSPSTTYSYSVSSCDITGNCQSSTGHSFSTSASASVNSGGGGGGGSGGFSNYIISDSEISTGVSKNLGKFDKMTFGSGSKKHSLSISEIYSSSVLILVQSNPIKFNLSIGEEKKLNLSSSEYYDTSIELEGIKNSKANISLKKIFEKIKGKILKESPENLTKKEIRIMKDNDSREEDKNFESRVLFFAWILVFIFAIILFWPQVKKRRKRKTKKGKKAHKKRGKHGKKSKKIKTKT